MSTMVTCPACGSDRVVAGQLRGGNAPPHFAPHGLRLLPGLAAMMVGDFGLEGGTAACIACGLVWTHTDVHRLRAKLREGVGAEEAKRLGLDSMPDVPEGRPKFPDRGFRRRDPAG